MCDDGDFDRWEEVLVEVTVLGVVPSEPFILERHEMVQEVAFDGPEKAWRMKVIGFVPSLLSGRIRGMVGMSASGSPIMFCSMWNFEGKVPRTGWLPACISFS